MGRTGPSLAGFEGGGRGHEPRKAGTYGSWNRQGCGFSPQSLQKGTKAC